MTSLNETSDYKQNSLAPLVDPYRERIEGALKTALKDAGVLPMYGMLRYFLGHEDEYFSSRDIPAGKRIRPSLFMYINDAFGGSKTAVDFAVAIELFHNFTLIHDDIEDNDEMRRGRKTVWKIWGVNNAINAGDAQCLLASQYLMRAALADPLRSGSAAMMLEKTFLEVAEGQYLDFELSARNLDDSSVTREAYLDMIRKKTSVLVGAASAAGGIAAGCSKQASIDLYDFGEALGVAYQIADDAASLWADSGTTGKDTYGDLYERKKTLPLLFAYEQSSQKDRLVELYSRAEPMTEKDVQEVLKIINQSDAYQSTKKEAFRYVVKAKEAVVRLSIDQKFKDTLVGIVDAFVQFPRNHV